MRNSTTWLPYPRSWVNAIAIFAIFFGLKFTIGPLVQLINWIAPFLPNIWSIFYLIVLISPIIIISFVHHWFHKALDQFVPDTRVVEVDGKPSIFPNIFSWWQGIYGLFVGTFSYLISLAILALIFSSSDFAATIKSLVSRNPILIDPIQIGQFAIQVIVAAYLYHMEFLVQQELLASSRR